MRALAALALIAAIAAAGGAAASDCVPPRLSEHTARVVIRKYAKVGGLPARIERCAPAGRLAVECVVTEPPYLDLLDEGLRDVYHVRVERRGYQLWIRYNDTFERFV